MPLRWDSHPGIGIHDLCSKPHCLIEFSAYSSLVIAPITAFCIWGNQRLHHSPQIPHLQLEFRTSPVSFTHSSMCGPHMCKAHTYPCANAPLSLWMPFYTWTVGIWRGTDSFWKWLGSRLPMRKTTLFTLASFIPEMSFLHVMLCYQFCNIPGFICLFTFGDFSFIPALLISLHFATV